ncbi:MAG: hypothetical protein ABR518_00010 [Actinomycetota bacterium]
MAIKGKAKGRSRRVVAAPPRPPVYVRKKPLFRRRWFLATIAALAVGGIVYGVLASIASNNREELRLRTSAAVNRFATAVESAFPPPPGSQALPPTGYAIYPPLLTDLDKVAKGDKKFDAAKEGGNLVTSAKNSADALAKINVRRMVPVDANVSEAPGAAGPGATRVVLLESQFLLQQAFQTFQTIGSLMSQAAALSGKDRTELVDEAKALTTMAQNLFRRGYQKIVTLKASLGLLQRNPFPSAPGGLGGA